MSNVREQLSPSKFLNYFQIIGGSSKKDLITISVYALISAIANTLIISILNAGADKGSELEISIQLLGMFVVAMIIFYISKRYILRRATKMAEESIYKIRVDIINVLSKAELRVVEEIGQSSIYTRITHDTNFISQSSAVIINGFQSAILVFFALMYVAYLSLYAFLITFVAVSLGSVVYLARQKKINEEIRMAALKETELFDRLSHILNGFRELKMSRSKNEDIMDHFNRTAQEGKEMKIVTGLRYAVGYMFSEMVFYTLIGTIVFILPQYASMEVTTLGKLTAAILFIIGPLENIVSTIPLFAKANISIENINNLNAQIENKVNDNGSKLPSSLFKDFKSIKLHDVSFSYKDKDKETTFSIGPISLEIKRNKLYIIKGGNGSGKSTLLKILTGLYTPESGKIEIDGEILQEKEYPAFREIFSIIFTDFHLFDRLYGIENIDEAKVNSLLKKFKIHKKTTFVDGKFTNLDLSTGQKKRLGLIVSILEDKPIQIYDEVAADQDPEFRDYFHHTILKELLDEGKTIVFVSHDDRYFNLADEVIKMENGLLK